MGIEITQIDMATAPDSLLAELADFYVVIEDEEIPGDTPMPIEARIAEWRQVSVHYPVARWILRDDDGLVGAAVAAFDADQNLENGFGRVYVHPSKRRQGYGTALARVLFDHLDENGRSRFDTMISKGSSVESVAEKLGLKPVYAEVRSRLFIDDLDMATMRMWIERAAERAADYELIYLKSPIPEDMVQKFCDLSFVINTAPREDFEEEDEVLTPEAWREFENNAKEASAQLHVFIAVERSSGEFAGYTVLKTLDLEPDLGWQWDTAVDPAHRNRGLGRWLKASMIERIISDYPSLRRVDTYNAGSNEPMLAINIEMGFRPIYHARAWQGDLATARARLGV